MTGLQTCSVPETLHSPFFFFFSSLFPRAGSGGSPRAGLRGLPPLSAGAGWSQAGRAGRRLPTARLLRSGYFKPTAHSSLKTGGGIFLSFFFFLF